MTDTSATRVPRLVRRRRRGIKGQVLPLFALSLVGAMATAAVVIGGSSASGTAVKDQGAADAASASAAQKWGCEVSAASGCTAVSGAPTSSSPTDAAVLLAQQVAAVNGVVTSSANYCTINSTGGTSGSYDVIFYDTAPSSHTAPCTAPTNWSNSVEVQIPPASPPASCETSSDLDGWWCISVSAKQKVSSAFSGLLGIGSAVPSASSVALAGTTSGSGVTDYGPNSATTGGPFTALEPADIVGSDGQRDERYNATSCVTATACMLVGSTTGYNTNATTAEINLFYGSAMQVARAGLTAHNSSIERLYGISCTGGLAYPTGYVSGVPSFCVAVGTLAWEPYAVTWNGSTRTWTENDPANLSAKDEVLTSVSCSSSTHCVAAGWYNSGAANEGDGNPNTAVYHPVFYTYSSGTWAVVGTAANVEAGTATQYPQVTGSTSTFVNGVSCLSGGSMCMAVGYYLNAAGYEQTLAYYTNNLGLTWTIGTPPDPRGSSDHQSLWGVSCASTAFCMAVGDQDSTSPALATIWNGTSWGAATTTQNLSGGVQTISGGGKPDACGGEDDVYISLCGVSCPTVNFCQASGEEQIYVSTGLGTSQAAGYFNQNMVENYCTTGNCNFCTGQTATAAWGSTGTTCTLPTAGQFNLVPVGNGVKTGNHYVEPNTLESVSCFSATACQSGGMRNCPTCSTSSNFAVAIGWGTSSLSLMQGNATGNGYMYGISCITSIWCQAVGERLASGVWQIETQFWNGVQWIKTFQSTTTEQLNGVSCVAGTVGTPSTYSCVAVGSGWNASSQGSGNIETYSGATNTWSSLYYPPIPSGGTSATLNNVSCYSASVCMAVGYVAASGGTTSGYTLKYSGGTWSQVTAATVSGNSNLKGVSCPTASFCMASGYYQPSGTTSLAEEWTGGSSWSQVTTVDSVESPDSGSDSSSSANAVSCTSATYCMLVGYIADSGSSQDQTLAEAWTGSGSFATTSPLSNYMAGDPAGEQANILFGVQCGNVSGTNQCDAVGYYSEPNVGDSGAFQTLLEAYNGSSWSVMPSLNAIDDVQSNEVDYNYSVAISVVGFQSGTAPTFVADTGYYVDSASKAQPLCQFYENGYVTDTGQDYSVTTSGGTTTSTKIAG